MTTGNKELLKKEVNGRTYSYIVETFKNDIVIDYSKGIQVEITDIVQKVFTETGGFMREMFKEPLLLNKYTEFQLFGIQLSATDFGVALVFLENGVIKDFKLTTDSQFLYVVNKKLTDLNVSVSEICTFVEINKKGYEKLLSYLYEPTSIYGTGLFTKAGEEILFGNTYSLDINENNKAILSSGFVDVSRLDVAKLELTIDKSVSLFGSCGYIKMYLSNGELLNESLVNYVCELDEDFVFNREEYENYVKDYAINTSKEVLHEIALKINKEYDKIKKDLLTYDDIKNKEELLHNDLEELYGYHLRNIDRMERDIKDFEEEKVTPFEKMLHLNELKYLYR